jgi:hypothetical protein
MSARPGLHGGRKVFVKISVDRVWYMAGKILSFASPGVLQAESTVNNAHLRLPCPSGEFFAAN